MLSLFVDGQLNLNCIDFYINFLLSCPIINFASNQYNLPQQTKDIMKTDILDESLESTSHDILHENQTQRFLLCSGKNQAFQLCLNQNCKQTPVFTCGFQNCQCQKIHFLCNKGNLQTALEIIGSKLKNTDQLKLQIEKTFDQIIDKLSDLRENLIEEAEENMKFIMLNETEQKLWKISAQGLDPSLINTSETAFLWQNFMGKHEIQADVFQKLIQQINSFQKTIDLLTYKTKISIKGQLRSFKWTNDTNFNYIQRVLKETQVLSSKQQVERLTSMFPRKIQSLRLLYQASKNDFSLEKYYDFCGTMTDTIIIVLTDRKKILGGYTPFCLWNGNHGWVADKQKKSFLFSISENQKFELVDKKYAIYRESGGKMTINFGNDLIISDKANIEPTRTFGQDTYNNPKYNKNQQSYLKLNGYETDACILKEWEVYKVEFKS